MLTEKVRKHAENKVVEYSYHSSSKNKLKLINNFLMQVRKTPELN